MKKRSLAIVLAAAMMLTGLAACGKKDPTPPTGSGDRKSVG